MTDEEDNNGKQLCVYDWGEEDEIGMGLGLICL